ncbi:hypothetical protein TEA_028577 [Camellia sinensis var. sinensis]|uniref:Pre-mRNA-splicing factor SLU7 n=1 Tax=Camellia sinensis var. sinensis TaxID=542762 RepID=A0A4S4EUI7_CAMSN|nr:hypothetical protein TEA_028577 [Camellia sinensis var. sinensis]
MLVGFVMWKLNLRIREDTAKYLLNLDVNSAHYDPKTRSMREDPLPDMDPNEKFYVGDNQNRISGEALEFKQLNIHAWEAFEKGHDVHMQAAPSQAELLYKNYKVNKEKLKSQVKETIMEKYGNAASEEQLPRELLLGQSEREVEYDHAGRIIKGQEQALPKSKYEEDVYINNHTSVWGSWWKDHQWGYKCCKQFIRNSYCTGAAGIEAAEAAADLMKANIAHCSYMSWWSLWFMEMEIFRVFNNNELSGKIPSTLGLLQTLEILYIEGNAFRPGVNPIGVHNVLEVSDT